MFFLEPKIYIFLKYHDKILSWITNKVSHQSNLYWCKHHTNLTFTLRTLKHVLCLLPVNSTFIFSSFLTDSSRPDSCMERDDPTPCRATGRDSTNSSGLFRSIFNSFFWPSLPPRRDFKKATKLESGGIDKETDREVTEGLKILYMPTAPAIYVLVFSFPFHMPSSSVPTVASFQTEALNCFMTSSAHMLGTTDWWGDTRERGDKCLFNHKNSSYSPSLQIKK